MTLHNSMLNRHMAVAIAMFIGIVHCAESYYGISPCYDCVTLAEWTTHRDYLCTSYPYPSQVQCSKGTADPPITGCLGQAIQYRCEDDPCAGAAQTTVTFYTCTYYCEAQVHSEWVLQPVLPPEMNPFTADYQPCRNNFSLSCTE